MFPTFLLKNHINQDDIQHIIVHNGVIFLKDSLKNLAFLAGLFIIYKITNTYIQRPLLKRIFALGGIIFLVKYIVDFLNRYLDCLILSKTGMTFFTRDSPINYKAELFDREKIETVTHIQNSMADKIFGKGDIFIGLEHGIEYKFTQVSNPKTHVDKILALKEQAEKHSEKKHNTIEFDPTLDQTHVQILTEALSEVVKEYMEKKKGE